MKLKKYFLILFLYTQFGILSALPIQAIIFDFGGVVATVDRSLLVQFMMDTFPISQEEAYLILQKWASHLRHEGDEMEFWNRYAHSLNRELQDDWLTEFKCVQATALHAIPETISAIRQLKQQGYWVGLLSNVTQQHADIIHSLGYYSLFNPLLLSCEMGVRKPDPRAYQMLLEQLPVSAEEVLFIDDLNANVKAAEKLGIHGIHFTHPEKLKEELHKHGIDID